MIESEWLNQSDHWDISWLIFFCINCIQTWKKTNGAKINEENIMQIIENFTFGNWQGARLNSKIA